MNKMQELSHFFGLPLNNIQQFQCIKNVFFLYLNKNLKFLSLAESGKVGSTAAY
jgi:hypothetical protein